MVRLCCILESVPSDLIVMNLERLGIFAIRVVYNCARIGTLYLSRRLLLAVFVVQGVLICNVYCCESSHAIRNTRPVQSANAHSPPPPLTDSSEMGNDTIVADSTALPWGWVEIGAGIHTAPADNSISFLVYDVSFLWQQSDHFGMGIKAQYAWIIRLDENEPLIYSGPIDLPRARRLDLFLIGAGIPVKALIVGAGVGGSYVMLNPGSDTSFSHTSRIVLSGTASATFVLGTVTLGYAYTMSVIPDNSFGDFSIPSGLHVFRIGLLFPIGL